MKELVEIQGKEAITTSLKVAEVFEKQHRNVVRDIEKLINDLKEVSERDVLNFEQIDYEDSKKRKYKAYQMNRDGFTLLAMGYTGKEALKFKTAYINAFNEMEDYIREMQKTSLNRDEIALIFQLVGFFKYLENCKMIEKTYRDTFISRHSITGKPYQELLKEFYIMRNNLLGIGGFKALQEKYKKYYIQNPNFRYNSKASKFSMIFTMDVYEPLRYAIADFLKLELQPDGYTLKIASEAKDLAKRSKTSIEKDNESNLFQVKDDELIEFGSLKKLASSLLKLN